MAVEVGRYLIIDPRVCHGEMTFKGTRVPVETVLVYLAKGRTIDGILESWPQLTREAVVEAIRVATAAMVERYTPDKVVHESTHSG